MTLADIRNRQYEPLEWEDRVIDSQTGNILVPGTPVNEENLNNIEAGILLAHYEIGLLASFLMQQTNLNRLEIEKYRKQRLQQGQATITSTDTNTYFRDAEPFVTVALSGFAQINAPNYDVLLTVTSADDIGRVGKLVVYDKIQNGFKVKMTGSAKAVSFMWTLLNPNV